jgi:hypothetical protein
MINKNFQLNNEQREVDICAVAWDVNAGANSWKVTNPFSAINSLNITNTLPMPLYVYHKRLMKVHPVDRPRQFYLVAKIVPADPNGPQNRLGGSPHTIVYTAYGDGINVGDKLAFGYGHEGIDAEVVVDRADIGGIFVGTISPHPY